MTRRGKKQAVPTLEELLPQAEAILYGPRTILYATTIDGEILEYEVLKLEKKKDEWGTNVLMLDPDGQSLRREDLYSINVQGLSNLYSTKAQALTAELQLLRKENEEDERQISGIQSRMSRRETLSAKIEQKLASLEVPSAK